MEEISFFTMPGGQEPKAKKRKRGDRREKEKPLLAVQGLLRLDHCFIKPNNDEAEVLEVVAGEETKKIVLAPDDLLKSEHDMVAYKAGYDTGPTNPLPQDEREEVIFAKQKVVEDAKEYFEEMKKETEKKRERKERLPGQKLNSLSWKKRRRQSREKQRERLKKLLSWLKQRKCRWLTLQHMDMLRMMTLIILTTIRLLTLAERRMYLETFSPSPQRP